MSKLVLALMLALSLGMTACSGQSNSGYYDTLCVNPFTQIRVDYTLCTTNPGWVYYVPYGYHYPAYGGHISNYTVNNYHRPSNATIHTGSLPSTAGSASKYSSGNTKVKSTSTPKPKTSGGSKGPSLKKQPTPKVRKK